MYSVYMSERKTNNDVCVRTGIETISEAKAIAKELFNESINDHYYQILVIEESPIAVDMNKHSAVYIEDRTGFVYDITSEEFFGFDGVFEDVYHSLYNY